MVALTVFFKTLTTLASLMALFTDARPTGTATGPVAVRRTSLSGGNYFPLLVDRHDCNDTQSYGTRAGSSPRPTAAPSMGFVGQQVSTTASKTPQGAAETGKPDLGLIGHQMGGGADY